MRLREEADHAHATQEASQREEIEKHENVRTQLEARVSELERTVMEQRSHHDAAAKAFADAQAAAECAQSEISARMRERIADHAAAMEAAEDVAESAAVATDGLGPVLYIYFNIC